MQGHQRRLPKLSLPAKMTELYQSYPMDNEGMVVSENDEELVMKVPEIVLSGSSSVGSIERQNSD